jgi:hypothetical protein
MTAGLLLHGVVPAEPRPALGADAPDAIGEAGLLGLVSPAPAGAEGGAPAAEQLAEAALAHNRILLAALEAGDVLPVRFGTVLPDAAAVCRLLRERAGWFGARLGDIAGAVEYALRVEERGAAGSCAPRTPARPEDGRAYLRARRDARADRRAHAARRTAFVRDLASRLSALSNSGPLPLRPGSAAPSRLADLTFLVRRAEVAPFLDRARSLAGPAEALGLSIELSGPWPPYAFAETRETGATEAGGGP